MKSRKKIFSFFSEKAKILLKSKKKIKKTFLSIMLANVSAAQLMKKFVGYTFSPVFFTAFSTLFLILCFPGYALSVVLQNKFKSQPLTFGLSSPFSLFGPGVRVCSLKPILTKILPLTLIYLVTNYLYARSLIKLSNTS